MRRFSMVLVLALILAGCGGDKALTNEEVEAMTDEGALAMADCQLKKAAEDLGQEGVIDRYGDALIGSVEEDGGALQVILHNDGYRCPEYLP